MDRSFEQIAESYCRQIRDTRSKILDDFGIAYAAHLHHLGKEFSLDDICLVEQINIEVSPGKLGARYWFELKPNFED